MDDLIAKAFKELPATQILLIGAIAWLVRAREADWKRTLELVLELCEAKVELVRSNAALRSRERRDSNPGD